MKELGVASMGILDERTGGCVNRNAGWKNRGLLQWECWVKELGVASIGMLDAINRGCFNGNSG